MVCVLAIDIGGTNLKSGLIVVDESVDILHPATVPMNPQAPAEEILLEIAEAARATLKKAETVVQGVGVGCPGIIDQKTGRVIKSPNLPTLNGFPVRKRLQELLGLPVQLQNDANAAVLGEWLFGPNAGVNNLILLTLGTGVGGGVIMDGRLLQGADYAAAELGHICIQPGGAVCGCGKKGCLEAYVGSAGIRRIAQQFLSQGGDTLLSADTLDTRSIHEAAGKGDAMARAILHQVGERLGQGIGTLIDVFNPEKIVLGGGASAAFEFLQQGIQDGVREYASFPETRERVKILPSDRPNDINLLGAAATYLNQKATLRRQLLVRRNNKPLHILGIHLGASSWHVGLSDYLGNVLVKDEDRMNPAVRRKWSYQQHLDEITKCVQKVLKAAREQGIALSSIAGAGVTVPAPVDSEKGLVSQAPALDGLCDAKLADDLSRIFREIADLNIPVRVDNDANGYALSELYFGVGKEVDHFVTILLVTGLGGAVVIDGELFHGHDGKAGEIGHITVVPEGAKCLCGNLGCLETVASGGALLKEGIHQRIISETKTAHYQDLIDAAKNGDKRAHDLFESMGSYLGIGISNVINVLNPSKVVLCGELSLAYEFFHKKLEIELAHHVFTQLCRDVKSTQIVKDAQILSAVSVMKHHEHQGA
jgi:glucokinase